MHIKRKAFIYHLFILLLLFTDDALNDLKKHKDLFIQLANETHLQMIFCKKHLFNDTDVSVNKSPL